MQRVSLHYGFADADWEAAREEARQAMIAKAACENTIPYSDLVSEIKSVSLEPHSAELDHMLGEISKAENDAGRGMLTVVVVHKQGDKMPGKGFFKLANSLGHDTTDRVEFWKQELEKVFSVWCESKKGRK